MFGLWRNSVQNGKFVSPQQCKRKVVPAEMLNWFWGTAVKGTVWRAVGNHFLWQAPLHLLTKQLFSAKFLQANVFNSIGKSRTLVLGYLNEITFEDKRYIDWDQVKWKFNTSKRSTLWNDLGSVCQPGGGQRNTCRRDVDVNKTTVMQNPSQWELVQLWNCTLQEMSAPTNRTEILFRFA